MIFKAMDFFPRNNAVYCKRTGDFLMVFPETGTNDYVKLMNLNSLFKLILQNQPISRAQLASLAGLSKVAVSSNIDFLLQKQVVREIGITDSKRGRPPILLTVDGAAGVIIGIEMDVMFNRMVVADIAGSILEEIQLPDNLSDDPPHFMDEISREIAAAKERYAHTPLGVMGVGMSVIGHYNQKDEVIEYAANRQNWIGYCIGGEFRKRNPNLPLFVERASDAGALGEVEFGKTRVLRKLAFVSCSWGIGVGVYQDINATTGVLVSSSRFGHTTINFNGPKCECGNRGCLECYASIRSLFRKLYPDSAYKTELLEDLADRLKSGEPQAVSAMHEVIQYLGIGIANVINAYRPLQVCIGGIMSSLMNEQMLRQIQQKAKEMVPAVFYENTNIYCSELGGLSIVLGAVAIVRNNLISIILDPPD